MFASNFTFHKTAAFKKKKMELPPKFRPTRPYEDMMTSGELFVDVSDGHMIVRVGVMEDVIRAGRQTFVACDPESLFQRFEQPHKLLHTSDDVGEVSFRVWCHVLCVHLTLACLLNKKGCKYILSLVGQV
jgi:hypothetical protein